MARIGTPNLNLGTWTDGEDPGAGSQTVDSDGVNGDRLKLDTSVGAGHTKAGAHKDDIIDGRNIKSSAVDGATLDVSASSGVKVLKVKDTGIDTAQLKDSAVTTVKIANNAVDSTKLKSSASVDADRAVTTDHIRDAAITASKLAGGITIGQLVAQNVDFQMLGDPRVAGGSPGNTPAANTEWTETSGSYVVKLSAFIYLPASQGYKYLIVRAGAKTSSALYLAKMLVEVTNSNGSASGSGVYSGTAYGASRLDITSGLIDIGALAAIGGIYEVKISLASDTGGGTATLRNPIIQLYKG